MRPAYPESRAGVTLVEMLLVFVIIALLAAIVMPATHRAILKARAAEAVGDLHVVRIAVHNYLGDHHVWPAEVSPGQVPSGLAPYLPDGFTFSMPHYVIDYDDLSSQPRGYVGLAIVTSDTELAQAMVILLRPNAWTDGGGRFTWVIEWSD